MQPWELWAEVTYARRMTMSSRMKALRFVAKVKLPMQPYLNELGGRREGSRS